jgi:putative tryptophan/tyrosine transport system substrate-binding protein
MGSCRASTGRGGNITGVSWAGADLTAKRLDLIRQFVGGTAQIGALVNPTYAEVDLQLQEIGKAEVAFGNKIRIIRAVRDAEIDTAFASCVQLGIGALIVANDPFFFSRRDYIVALAGRHAIPTIYYAREFTAVGGLMSYGTSVTAAFRQGGIYAGKILKGTKPSELPVLLPTKFEFVINMKAAKRLGFNIPPTSWLAPTS